MRPYIISTDSTADLPDSFSDQHDISIQPLFFYVNDVAYSGLHDMSGEEFYNHMRNDAEVRTAATSPEQVINSFTALAKQGYDILHISFSSGLSSSHNSAVLAAETVMDDFPDTRIEVIDSLCASLGQGLLVYYAVKLKEEGKSLDEVYDWVRDNRLNICHQFTVEDLKYLYKGGRVSRTAAVLGTIINIKPVLHVDDEGHLTVMSKVRGRKKSLNTLVDNMEAQAGSLLEKNDCVFISHGDCIGDALYVADLVKDRFGIEATIINNVSPTIGAHSGPGTLALFHLGDSRMIGCEQA